MTQPIAKAKAFEWDVANLRKVQQRIDPALCELAFEGNPWVGKDMIHSASEPRWFLINRVGEQTIFIIFTRRNDCIRIISARFMHQKEYEKYEKKFNRF
jgi:uncharacterized DUF497 family protein